MHSRGALHESDWCMCTAECCRTPGPSATYVLAAGSCNLARVTTPLAAEYIVTCVAPSATLTVTQPRYIAEHVTAATFRTSVSAVTAWL